MSEFRIRYKNCTPEDIDCLKRFEPEIEKAVMTVKGRAEDVYWEPVVSPSGSYSFFSLYFMSEPREFLGGSYGLGFLKKVSRDEFFDWLMYQKWYIRSE